MTKIREIIALSLVLNACSFAPPQEVQAPEIKNFKTDKCTLFPDHSQDEVSKWADCCVAHDFTYWMGGTSSRRDQSDDELKQCVHQRGAEQAGQLMHFGVQLAGAPGFLISNSTPWVWGFGWNREPRYQNLSPHKRLLIAQKMHTVLQEYIRLKDDFSMKQRSYLIKHLSKQVSEFEKLLSPKEKKELEELELQFLNT